MTSERWQRISRVYHEALARDASERSRFLDAACATDAVLRKEVESLLAQANGGDFLSAPAVQLAAGMATSDVAPLIGRQIGPYRVAALLGAGGMGEVYRARDVKLGRDVAIKVLPPAFTDDPDRLARFEREARVLASLNHPHIGAIYGLEESEGTRALILELVDGDTLAQHIERREIPLREALIIARQIAEALEAAHDRGVIHRDLKPGNVAIARDGAVKVLDFGLAKILTGGEVAPVLSQLPTVTASDPGAERRIGTLLYMSPEHVRGQPVDRRTDIWAFGCVLFELLTRRSPFVAATASDTIARILGQDPDWSALPDTVPAAIVRLLRRSLQRDMKQRLRDIGDARIELDEALSELSATPSVRLPSSARRAGRRLTTIVLAASLVAASIVIGRRMAPDGLPSAPVRVVRLTDAQGLEEFPALSPDGKSVAFVARAGTNLHIFVRLLAGGGALQVTRDATDHLNPRWSSDSASILYYAPSKDPGSPGTLWEIPALGGQPRRITSSLGSGDISHDGTRIVFPRLADGHMELAVAARDGSAVKTVATLESGYYYLTPRWSPQDRLIAYQRGISNVHEIFVVSADGGQPRQITEHAALLDGLTWDPAGERIIFSSSQGATIWYLPETNFWSVDTDGRNLRQLTFGEASYTSPDMNSSGTIVAARVRREFDIWRYPVNGSPADNVRRGTRITNQTSNVHTPSVAPDDGEVVYVSDSGGHANLWTTSLTTGESRQLTFERDPARRVGLPLWSPDGKHIAYFMTRGSSFDYFLMNADGSNSRLLFRDAGGASWSPDGKWLYYGDYPVRKHLRKVSVAGGAPEVVRDDNAAFPAVAPDGTTLYYVIELPVVSGGSDFEIRVARPESAASQVLARIPAHRMEPSRTFQPVISPDGKWLAIALFDQGTSNLWAISTSTGDLRQLTDFGQRATYIPRRVSWASDSESIFAAVGEGNGDVVLLEGLKP